MSGQKVGFKYSCDESGSTWSCRTRLYQAAVIWHRQAIHLMPTSETCLHRTCQHLPNMTCYHYTLSQSRAITGSECSHAVLYLIVTRRGVQGAEGKVREGVNSLAEARRQAGQQQEQGSRALQAQQAATQAAQQQLQAAQVLHAAKTSRHNVCAWSSCASC